jgi:hypothetical protein
MPNLDITHPLLLQVGLVLIRHPIAAKGTLVMNMNRIHQLWLTVLLLLLVISGLHTLASITQGTASLDGFSYGALSGLLLGAAGITALARLNRE